jgi:hypothetical protein
MTILPLQIITGDISIFKARSELKDTPITLQDFDSIVWGVNKTLVSMPVIQGLHMKLDQLIAPIRVNNNPG